MSLTYELDATADAFSWGLLAAKVSGILQRPTGFSLGQEEKETLKGALRIITQLLDGAKTLHSGHSMAGVTSESIKSLGLALTPLQQLQSICGTGATSDENIIALLGSMANALPQVIDSPTLPEKTHESELTATFFSYVADRTLSSLNRSHRSALETLA